METERKIERARLLESEKEGNLEKRRMSNRGIAVRRER